ncbi:MAG: ribosome recycling factor [Clostridiales bacterium]|nr:ribosome recycling factor [Clostridiales bacterium]MCF8022168.1 ribosome recycling factor [Clostridiales bacterium]
MANSLLKEAENNMQKSLDVLKGELASLRAGRATPALLDKVKVDYYGVQTPLNQLASITAPEPRMLVIQPYDKSIFNDIEKAIMKSDLGITPANDGKVIRLSIPQLTEERRNELVKVVKKKAEEGRVAVRNIRRDVNDMLKKQQKKSEISEDDLKRLQDDVQKLTDKYIKKIDDTASAKEKDIMTL